MRFNALRYGLSLLAAGLVCQWAPAQVPERPRVAVVSAASYEAPIAPDSIAALFGSNLASSTLSAATQPLPLRLGTTSVTLKDARDVTHSAGLFFVSPTQINFLVPAQAAPGLATVIVSNGAANIEGTVTITAVAPGLFAANANGQGPALGLLLRVAANGSQTSEPLAEFNQACQCFVARPVSFGTTADGRHFLVLFGTGWRNRANPRDVALRISGVTLPVDFAGAQGGFAGLDQLNVALPNIFGDLLTGRRTGLGVGRFEIALNIAGAAHSNVVEVERAIPRPLVSPILIAGFEPARALAGERLVIRGSGFDLGALPGGSQFVSVGIGAFEAPVLAVTNNTITVRVPVGVTSGLVRVRVRQSTGVSANVLPVRTSLSGLVEDTRRRPLAGVRVNVSGTEIVTRTNAEGLFVLPDLAANQPALISIDGTGLGLTAEYPRVRLSASVTANRDNFIAHPIVLQQATGTPIPLMNALASGVESVAPAMALRPEALWPLAAEFDTAQQQLGSFSFTVPKETIVLPICDEPAQGTTCLRPITQLTLTQIENSRTPVPLPRGVFSASIAQISPLNASLLAGGTLTLPNADRWMAGQAVRLFHLSQALDSSGQWSEISGRLCALGLPCPGGRVSSDGTRVESVEGMIATTGIYFAALERTTTTVVGRLLQPVAGTGAIIIDGGTGQPIQPLGPAVGALVCARGQCTVTDGNGGFILRYVPVLTRGDLATVEFSLLRGDERGNQRVERFVRTGVDAIPDSIADLGTIETSTVFTNRPPLIFAGARFTAQEGRANDYELLITDADSDADPTETLRVSLNGPAFAALIARGNGRYTLRVTPGFADAGEQRIVITATDRAGATATHTIALTVTDVNQTPRALAQTVTLDEDTVAPLVLMGADADRDALRFIVVTPPRNGRLSGDAPDLRYTPNANYFGEDGFTFKVSDGVAESEPATVTLRINAVNDEPTLAVPNEQRVVAGQALSFTVTADDADAADRLRISAVNLPTGATLMPLTEGRAAARFAWMPGAMQTGLFILTLQVTDDGTPPLTTAHTVAITVVANAESAAGVWTATGGPTGGTGLTAIYATDGLLLAGDGQYGVYRSTNNGRSWTRNETEPARPVGVRSFAAGNTSLFAAASIGGIFRSEDRGASWQVANQGLPADLATGGYTPSLVAAGGTTVYASLINNLIQSPQPVAEIYRSTDNGVTWTRAEGGLPRFGAALAVAFSGTQTFIAYNTSLYRSGDNGANWQNITPKEVGNFAITSMLTQGGNVFLATAQGLLRTSDQGANWILLDKAPANLLALVTSGGNLFGVGLAGTQQTVFRSTDNGATWTRAGTGLPPTGDFAPVSTIQLTANATHLFANAFGRVYVSANQGDSWEPAAALTNLAVNALATLPVASETRLYAGTNLGVFTANAPWRDWMAANDGLPLSRTNFSINQLLPFGDQLFAVWSSGIYRTAGRGWEAVSTSFLTRLSVLQSAGAHRTALFVSVASLTVTPTTGFTQTVYRSLDRGATWEEANTGLPAVAVTSFAATGIEGDVMLAGTAGGGVYLSANNGTTWRAMNQGLPANSVVTALASLPGGSRWFAATTTGLYVFTPASAAWTQVATGLPADALVAGLHVAGEQLFAIAGSRNTPCAAGGIPLPDPVTGIVRCFGGIGPVIRTAEVAAPEQLATVTEGLAGDVYLSTDQGQTWALVNNGLPRGATRTISATGRTVFAGTAGGGVFVRQF